MAKPKRKPDGPVQVTTKTVGKRTFTRSLSFLPFWAPWKKPEKGQQKHPATITGVVSNVRKMPKHGKFEERDAFDVIDSEEGVAYTVTVSGSLKTQVAAADLGGGETVMLEYLGERQLKGRRPMHVIELWVEK